jgi:hypothetical protein
MLLQGRITYIVCYEGLWLCYNLYFSNEHLKEVKHDNGSNSDNLVIIVNGLIDIELECMQRDSRLYHYAWNCLLGASTCCGAPATFAMSISTLCTKNPKTAERIFVKADTG